MSRPSLLIDSTDSMITFPVHIAVGTLYVTSNHSRISSLSENLKLNVVIAWTLSIVNFPLHGNVP